MFFAVCCSCADINQAEYILHHDADADADADDRRATSPTFQSFCLISARQSSHVKTNTCVSLLSFCILVCFNLLHTFLNSIFHTYFSKQYLHKSLAPFYYLRIQRNKTYNVVCVVSWRHPFLTIPFHITTQQLLLIPVIWRLKYTWGLHPPLASFATLQNYSNYCNYILIS